ncbi:Ig-like domain (group 3), partial [Actinacidiphila yanglinensis]
YNGSTSFNTSTSPTINSTVNKANSTTTLTSNPNPSTFGQAVILTSTVAIAPPGAGTPTGTVSFFDGATLLGTGTLGGGTATLTTSTLAVGTHNLTAVYGGSTNINVSTSPINVQTVM